jgi:pimeloyl-ACP methyl ester carboxylesterase
VTLRPLVEERIACRQTTISAITDCATANDDAADRPVLVLLHGYSRTRAVFLDDLAPYRAWADVLVPDLPGSGQSQPPLDVGIGPIADEIVSLLRRRLPNRRLVLLGESMGGLVGLACCDGRLSIAGLVLLDPPLSMAKQWVIQLNIVHACEQTAHWFPHAVADAVFGVDCATGAVHERLYYAGFAGLSVPCLIVRGDNDLFPVRSPERVPNCFDDVDAMIVRMLLPSCRIERLSGCGHLIYSDGGLRCHDLVRDFVADIADV